MEENEDFMSWLLDNINFWHSLNKNNVDDDNLHFTSTNVLDQLVRVLYAYRKFNGESVGCDDEFAPDDINLKDAV